MIRATKTQTAHFLLQKSYLSDERATDFDRLVKSLVAIPIPGFLAPNFALHARLDSFNPNHLTNTLNEVRSLIKRPTMRNAPYLVCSDDFIMFQAATQRQRRQHFNREFIGWQIEAQAVESLAEAIMADFGEVAETVDAVAARLLDASVCQLTQTSRGGRVTHMSNVGLALLWLEADGQLVDTQLASEASYMRTSTWWPHLDLASEMTEAEAQLRLVRAYLSAYGPASEADISFWTGFGKSETQRAVNTLSRETTLTMVEGIPGALLLLKDQADALHTLEPSNEPILNVLPVDDPFVTAHKATRARLLADPRLRRQVFSSTDHAKPTIVFDGVIVGVWEQVRDDDAHRIEWRLFDEIDSTLMPVLEVKLNELGAFMGSAVTLEQKTGGI